MKVVETKLPAGEIIDIAKLGDGTWVVKQKVSEARKNPQKARKKIGD
jgi:hypothetical protein